MIAAKVGQNKQINVGLLCGPDSDAKQDWLPNGIMGSTSQSCPQICLLLSTVASTWAKEPTLISDGKNQSLQLLVQHWDVDYLESSYYMAHYAALDLDQTRLIKKNHWNYFSV